MKMRQQSADNITFGMGGALLQRVDRDTMNFAMKASAAKVEGLWRDVYKDPITDKGKRSKKGRLAVVKDEILGYKTIQENDLGRRKNTLEVVYKNGKILKSYTFDEVRKNVDA